MITTSGSIAQLAEAMAKAQAELPSISLDRQVSYKAVTFEYASLSNIIYSTKPVLAKHGLSILQFPSTLDGVVTVETLILHNSGESICSEISARVGKADDPKEIGSMITYLRRYAYGSVLSIALDGDYDGEVISQKYLATPEHKVWLRDILTPQGIDRDTMKLISDEMTRGNYEMSEDAVQKALEAIRK